jgi:hypothetical protein
MIIFIFLIKQIIKHNLKNQLRQQFKNERNNYTLKPNNSSVGTTDESKVQTKGRLQLERAELM